MGRVSDHLRQLIAKHVQHQGVVVWYDPDGKCGVLADTLELPGVTFHRYRGSYFLLRHEIESALKNSEVPQIVIYVPKGRSETGYALAEAEAAGTCLAPGEPDERDTSLVTLGRAALSSVLSAKALDELLQNVQLTLSDLDRVGQGAGLVGNALGLVFRQSSSPSDIAFQFIIDRTLDERITAANARDALALLLNEHFGLSLPGAEPLDELAQQFINHVLLTDFRSTLPSRLPISQLNSVPLPKTQWQIEANQRLAEHWRDSAKNRVLYEQAARQVEKNYDIGRMELEPAALRQARTFPSTEERILRYAEQRALEGAYGEVVELAEERSSTFWYAGETASFWSVLRTSAELLSGCMKVTRYVSAKSRDVSELIIAYVSGVSEDTRPWCDLDTLHRKMERLAIALQATPALEQIIAKARIAYTTLMDRLAEQLGDTLAREHYQVPNVAPQISVFREHVAPRLENQRVAYFWIDALRYEMARELLAGFAETSRITLVPALASIPTVTTVGMAALLPGAEHGLGIIEVRGKDKLAVELNGFVLKGRRERVTYISQRSSYVVEVITLAALLKPTRVVRERLNRAQLIVVTAQELDHIAEDQVPYLSRVVMDDLLTHLKRAMSLLSDFGIHVHVLTSDHGFLFGDEVGPDMLMEPPDGHQVKLTQRVWIGRGGSTPTASRRVRASEVGLAGDLELVFPRGLAGFLQPGGSDPYFHGGLSLQELVIPLAVVELQPTQLPMTQGELTLQLESNRITSRIFTVVASFSVTELFDSHQRTIRCIARLEGEVVANTVAAVYGFDERVGAITMVPARSNYITLMLTRDIIEGELEICLLDAETGTELECMKGVTLDISH